MKAVVLISFLCLATVLSQTTPNPVLQQFMAKVRVTVEQLFTQADVNKNGQFDMSDLSNIFTAYDTNGDGQVTRTEFVTHFANNSVVLQPVAAGLFIDLDMDKNGTLESQDTQLYYDKIDQNDDGRVDHQEFTNYFTQLFEVLFILAIRAEKALSSTPAPA